jgi:hypothetical protein
LQYTRSSSGTSIEPCGTPDLIGSQSEQTPWRTASCTIYIFHKSYKYLTIIPWARVVYELIAIYGYGYQPYTRRANGIIVLSPSRLREAPCEGTNSPRLFTPGETKALAKSKVHQSSRAWVTNDVGVLGVWSSSLISKIWRTVMNSGHWLVQFKVCIITTAWRQRNSKHFLIWWMMIDKFLANIFHFCSHFCKNL